MQHTRAGRSPRPQKVEAVLAAARKLFLQNGFSGTTTDKVQKEAGVSKATLYNCYATKEDLFTAVIERECENFLSKLKNISVEQTHFEQELHRLGVAYLSVLLQKETLDFFRVMVNEASRFPELTETFYHIGPKVTLRTFADTFSHYITDSCQFSSDQLAAFFMSLLRSEIHIYSLLHPANPVEDTEIKQTVATAVEAMKKLIHSE